MKKLVRPTGKSLELIMVSTAVADPGMGKLDKSFPFTVLFSLALVVKGCSNS